MKAYTTWGPIRGWCGHVHEGVETAQRCLTKDRRDCQKEGNRSDRQVRRIFSCRDLRNIDANSGPGEPLDLDEVQA